MFSIDHSLNVLLSRTTLYKDVSIFHPSYLHTCNMIYEYDAVQDNTTINYNLNGKT